MTHATPSRYARYVGRVGALAFALGVGVAIADHGPVAYAEAGTPSSSSASDSPGSSPGPTRHSRQGSAAPARSRTAKVSSKPSAAVVRAQAVVTVAPAASRAADDPADPPPAATFAEALGAARRPKTATSPAAVPATLAAEPTTVLATPEQLAAEQTATELARSPFVQLAKLVLKAGWKSAAKQGYALVGGPDQENLDQLDQAITEYANQAAMEVQLLDSNNPRFLQQVAPAHSWYSQTFTGSRIWYDNPDTIYRFVGVNAASSYVITGQFTGELPADTNFSVLTGLNGATAANINGKELVVDANGNFTITVDSKPAAPGQANHLQLPTAATLITTRNTLADWSTQDPMSLSITRLGGPPDSLFSQLGGFAFPGIGPLVSGNKLLTALVSLIPPVKDPHLLQSIETAAIMLLLGTSGEKDYISVATTDPTTGELRKPNQLSDPDHNAAFLATQLQSAGYFQLEDDEALVLTIDPGRARYFSVPVTNDWTITDNYWDQQTSLNVAQAVANTDRTYTIVVSPTDPGVANWVSTGGLNQGTLSIRFQDFDPASTADPKVSSVVVKLNELDDSLPDETAYVTAAERAAQIAERQAGYNRRYGPYPQT